MGLPVTTVHWVGCHLSSIHLGGHFNLWLPFESETLKCTDYVPLYIAHEDGDEVENMFETFRRGLQNVVRKSPQEDEEISQVLSKKLLKDEKKKQYVTTWNTDRRPDWKQQ